MSADLDFEGATCPLPLRQFPQVVMGHGGGGKLSAELVEHLFAPAFDSTVLDRLGDSAVLERPAGRIAVSTDSFVVQPLFFPGGDIGQLAVHGTVNDVAMSGAVPQHLTCGFILEEGFGLDQLNAIALSMAAAARHAGVELVAGDTKVVDRGHGDGVYITTTGIGVVPDGVDIGPHRASPGDKVIVSGTLGDHGMAIMSRREGLEFTSEIASDTAALNHVVADLLAAAPDVHVLRDPTRGGLAATLNEIAAAAQVGITYTEALLPVDRLVAAACEMLGMDPVYVANEGKLVAIVPPEQADAALEAIRRHPEGERAAVIGEVVADHPGMVAARTGIGGTRVVDTQIGAQLPRIC
ncbi:hydrogenase expression/formation protein HypE [Euzebya sp.]|uniref:hydrogenase expression/formation protein HypE n=1 Tax=Euzebya sp. TaxID=1971409 RepID=UPI0035138AD8